MENQQKMKNNIAKDKWGHQISKGTVVIFAHSPQQTLPGAPSLHKGTVTSVECKDRFISIKENVTGGKIVNRTLDHDSAAEVCAVI